MLACAPAGVKADRLCTPKANVYCRCEDRKEGTKKCSDDGQSFGECGPCDGSSKRPAGRDPLGNTLLKGEGEGEGESPLGAEDPPTGEDPPQTEPGEGEGEPEPGTEPEGTSTRKPTTAVASTEDPATYPDEIHCKALKNIAPKIELQRVADEPNAATGGKPVPGLYVQSWVIEFTKDGGETGPSKLESRQTLEIADDVGRYVLEDKDGKTTTGGFRMTQEGTSLTFAYECPAAEPKELQFDASDSTLILYDPPYARVFTRQKESQ